MKYKIALHIPHVCEGEPLFRIRWTDVIQRTSAEWFLFKSDLQVNAVSQ